MPYSSTMFDQYVTNLIAALKPATILDIGAGAGKYGRIIQATWPSCISTAVEIDPEYIEQFDLRSLYTHVINDDVMTLLNKPRERYDLVIIGDCIEHLNKSQGIDLLNYLMYRSGYICVVYPEAFLQDDLDGHMSEVHRSTWSVHDFVAWLTIHHANDFMHLALIKAYQPSSMIFTS